eukprot:Platyproteum_vivax@DN6636_c0_g1_i2.p1
MNQMEMGKPMGEVVVGIPQIGMPVDGYSVLAGQSKVIIKEKMKNAYSICTPGGPELFVATENSSCREKSFCIKDCKALHFDISMFPGSGMPVNIWHAERSCMCSFCCFKRPTLHVTDALSGNGLATIVDPFACNPTFNVQDDSRETVLRARGGCCQCGMWFACGCGPCAKVSFTVEDAKSGDQIGAITKVVPGCCKFLISDADNYEVEFGAVSNPQWKAIVVILAIFMDFRYFDNRNEAPAAHGSY